MSYDKSELLEKIEQAFSHLAEMADSFKYATDNFEKLIEKFGDVAVEEEEALEAIPDKVAKQWEETCDTIAELYSTYNYGKYCDYVLDDEQVEEVLDSLEQLDQQELKRLEQEENENTETQTKSRGR